MRNKANFACVVERDLRRSKLNRRIAVNIYKYFVLIVLFVCQISTATTLRDPTALPAGFGELLKAPNNLTLRSILISPHRRVAIINGEIVGLGDHIDGARVMQILENKVLLSQDNKIITLYLIKEKIKVEQRETAK